MQFEDSLHLTFAWCTISFVAVNNYISIMEKKNQITSLYVVIVPVKCFQRETASVDFQSKLCNYLYAYVSTHRFFSHL